MVLQNEKTVDVSERADEKLPKAESLPKFSDILDQFESAEEVFEIEEKVAREYKDRIGEIIEPSEAAIERTNNMLNRASAIESFARGEEIGDKAERGLAQSMAERGWASLFTELKSGDQVAYFTTPGGEFSIKSFNTKFGEQATDSLIKARKEALARFAAEKGISTLVQDFKGGFLKMPENFTDDELAEALNDISDKVNEQMSKLVFDAISQADPENTDKDLNRLRNLSAVRSEENDKLRVGYRMSWGLSRVAESASEADRSNVVKALAEAGVASQHGRGFSGELYGTKFDKEGANQEVGEINKLGEELAGHSVSDENGISYDIFSKDREGFRIINKDLLRLVRKGDFHPNDESKALAGQVEQYVRRINLIDMVKPFIASEAMDGTLAERASNMKKFLDSDEAGAKIRKDLTQEERSEFAEELKRDQKDSRFLSPEFFHQEAMKLKECAYVNIDVLDLGVDQLMHHERALQVAYRNPEELQRVMSEAGDSITKQMRDIRGIALKVYKRYFGDSQTIGKVGGDEVAFAVENPSDPKIMEKFLIDLQSETGTRVIKTVVGEAERSSKAEWDPEESSKTITEKRLREHLTALLRAEQGTEVCKAIEKKMRSVRKILETRMGNDMEKIGRELDALEVSQFEKVAVRETAKGGFDVIFHHRGREIMSIDGDEALAFIESKVDLLKKQYLG